MVRDEWGYHPIADGREEMRAAVAALPRESGNGKGPKRDFLDLLWTHDSSHAMQGSRMTRISTCVYWWKGRDSNPRPRHYECRALTS